MDAWHWLLLLVICAGLIGFVVLPAPDEVFDDGSKAKKLKYFIIILVFEIIISGIGLYSKTLDPRVKEPSKGFGDTPVDWLLDEIKADDKATYTKVEVLNLVYKYLREYTREGKYEERTVIGKSSEKCTDDM